MKTMIIILTVHKKAILINYAYLKIMKIKANSYQIKMIYNHALLRLELRF